MKYNTVYTLSVASNLTGISLTTISRYESSGMIKFFRRNNRRLLNEFDLTWLRRIQFLLHDWGFDFRSLRLVLGVLCRREDDWRKCKYTVVESTDMDPCWIRQDHLCSECRVYRGVVKKIVDGNIDTLLVAKDRLSRVQAQLL